MTMKFRSTTGEDVHIALTTGHTALITPDGVELDKVFHKEAIARGCLPEGVEEDKKPEGGGFDRMQVITDTLNAMVDGSDEKDFKGDGTPNLKSLTTKVGFTVSREEADAAWAKVSAK
jgi:hypothetical protein